MKAPAKRMSNKMAMAEVKMMPATQQRKIRARRVYRTPRPEMPSTALRLLLMGWLFLCRCARK